MVGDDKQTFDKLEKSMASMQFSQARIYHENFVIVQMRKLETVLNKPRQVQHWCKNSG